MTPKQVHDHTILVVDDDADIREVLTEVLAEQGYRALTASNGAEALSILRNGSVPCMVLLDLMMPVMDGYLFLEEFKREPTLASIPVAVITAGRQVEWERLGGTEVVSKPIRLPHLMSIIHRNC
jgi:CheY-like chemotaxis protein